MPRVLPRGTRRLGPDQRLSVVGHLDELRRRLIVSAVALVVAFAGMYAVHGHIIDLLTWPLPDDSGKLITLSPTEPFFTSLKVSLWAAALVVLPVLAYQVYAFIAPAVGEHSKRVGMAVVGSLVSLFVAGLAFGFTVVLPFALKFLLGFGDDSFSGDLRAASYFGFVMALTLGAGLMFQLPAVMAGLARMGLTDADFYKRNWRVAIVAIAAVAAVLPGGDPVSMFLLMVPQVLLYGLGVVLAGRFHQEPLWRQAGGWGED
ncbi:MAG: twin-arginine translocase subunit TatC [Miltoncostaeaceae bacterium]